MYPIDSTMVNEYLQRLMGSTFTAKDFRTWNATLMALDLLRRTPLPDPPSESALKSSLLSVVREVATELRNTPTVCRKSYINPAVFDAWREGRLSSSSLRSGKSRSGEKAMLRFLNRLSA